MRTLENIILKQSNVIEYYTAITGTCLWRAVNLQNVPQNANPLYPVFEPRRLPNGKIRGPDIAPIPTRFGPYVRADVSVGTSLMDVENGFGKSEFWEYHIIPAGTPIPYGVIVTRDRKMKLRDGRECHHYSISPNWTMSRKAFSLLLDNFAVNAHITLKATA